MAHDKFITIMVIPDRKNKGRKIVIAASHLKFGLALVAILVVVFAGILVDYVGLLSQSIENKRLHAENSELRVQFKLVESKLSSIETTLERVKTLTTKLKLITSVNDPDRGLNLAMGPQTRDEVEEMENESDRAPASKMSDEPVFKTKSLPDFTSNILAEEKDRDYAKLSIHLDRVVKKSQLREVDTMQVMDFMKDRESILSSTPIGKPAQGWITSGFGQRISPFTGQAQMHEGLDIAASPGSPVFATADGLVSAVKYDAGYGKVVYIQHGYGIETRFGHNSQTHVNVGQRVRRGDLIANVGNTGRSTAPHLHYEVLHNGAPINPQNFILE